MDEGDSRQEGKVSGKQQAGDTSKKSVRFLPSACFICKPRPTSITFPFHTCPATWRRFFIWWSVFFLLLAPAACLLATPAKRVRALCSLLPAGR